jgi:hypothetical protein
LRALRNRPRGRITRGIQARIRIERDMLSEIINRLIERHPSGMQPNVHANTHRAQQLSL